MLLPDLTVIGVIDVKMSNGVSQTQLIQHLSDCGLLCPQSITDGSMLLTDYSSRNMNLLLNQERAIFIKVGLDAERKHFLQREATIYSEQESRALNAFLPSLIHFDHEHGILITEGLPDALSLQHVLDNRALYDLDHVGAQVGQALSAAHCSELVDNDAMEDILEPWQLTFAAPSKEVYVHFSSATRELTYIIQQNEAYSRELEKLRNDWRPTVFSHNDFKPNNILLTLDQNQKPSKVRIIDWEGYGPGDPCWDVATLWAQVLKIWIDSVQHPGEQNMKADKKPEELFAFNRAFWNHYSSDMSPLERHIALLRCVQYTGAGLLNVAVELTELTTSLRRTDLLYLQVSQNLILRPAQAARSLLGL